MSLTQTIAGSALDTFAISLWPTFTATPAKAKRALKAKGWTQTSAAKELGVTREHINRVLNARRVSRSLLRRYRALKQETAR